MISVSRFSFDEHTSKHVGPAVTIRECTDTELTQDRQDSERVFWGDGDIIGVEGRRFVTFYPVVSWLSYAMNL